MMRYTSFIAVVVWVFILVSTVYAADAIKGKIEGIDLKVNIIKVAGITIDAKEAIIKDETDKPINLSALSVGDDTAIKGYLTGPRQMAAMKIKREYAGYEEIEGRIEKMDLAGGSITIGGVIVKIPQNIWIQNHTGKRVPLQQFAINYSVKCLGTWTGPAEFIANKIETE